jgi:NADH-quinone oxidoreductase subunit K
MTSIPIVHFLYLAAVLFGIGLFGVLARKNAISVLMGVELMLNAVNINYLAFAKYWNWNSLTGPVFVVFVITIAAAEAAVALAIIISIYRQMKSTNVDEVNYLRG